MFLSILPFIGNLLLFMLVLSVVICIHELGHLYFAKKAGVLCHEFAFGMGPRLWSKKVGETIYSVRAFPFGGFVSMAGEEIESIILKIGQEIHLGFNEEGLVNRIFVKKNKTGLESYQAVKVESFNLQGMDGSDLLINEYKVASDALYVFDKNEMQIAPYDRVISNKTFKQRFWVMFGGPMMNLILAFVLFLFLSFMIGVPDSGSTVISNVSEGLPAYNILLPDDEILAINSVEVTAWRSDEAIATVTSELAKYEINDTFIFTVLRDGEEVVLEPITPQYIFFGLGFVSDPSGEELTIIGSVYAESELLPGDKIVSIDGTSFTTWNELIAYALLNTNGSTPENPTEVTVLRDGELKTFSYVAYGNDVLDAMGYSIFVSQIGISGSNHFSFFGSIEAGSVSFYNAGTSIYKTLGLLFTSDQVGVSDLSGFVGIFSITANAASQGFYSLIGWVALLSVNLGLVNLLPIPALDGGRIAFLFYEKIANRKINPKVEAWINNIAFFLLMGLLLFVTYNDILRAF